MKDNLQDEIIQILQQIEALQGDEPVPRALALKMLKDSLAELKSANEMYGQRGKACESEEEVLRQMIAQSPDRFFRQDRELRYTWISHASLFGYPSSDLLGKTSFEIFSPEEAKKLTRTKRRVMETGKGVRVEIHMPINGEERYFDAFYEPWRNGAGEILGIAGYVRDITERKLADAETRRMTRAVETAPTAIVLTDLEGMIEYVNPGFMEMGGFKNTSEVLGRSVFEFTDDAGKSKLMDEIIPALNSKGQWRGEMPVQNKGKRAYFVEMICSLVKDDLGRPSYFLANFYNITDRKRAEEALLLDESRLEALLTLNQMDEATIQEITDFALEAGVKLTSSRLGYLAFVDDDEKTLVMHSWSKNAMAECKAHKQTVYPLETTGLWGEALRQRKAIITNDYSSCHLKKGLPKGHIKVLRHMNVPIFDRGRVVAIAGVGNKEGEYDDTDVRQLTLLMSGMWKLIERRRAEEALNESQRTLSTLMSNLPGMAYRCRNDRNWTMEFVSDGSLELTGYLPSELVHNSVVSYGQIIHPDDREYVWDEIQEALSERRPYMLIYRIRSPERTKWVWEQGQGIFSPDSVLLALEGFVNDITERKLAEEALRSAHDELEKRVEERTAWLLRANEALHEEMAEHKKTEKELRKARKAADAASKAKSEFLANMSHEIRTPMNAVIGMSGLLLGTDLAPEQRDYVETIRSSGDALLAIINDILDFSKIDEGKMEIERQPFDLVECIESSLDLVAAKAREKGLNLTYLVAKGVPGVILGDAAKLRQVLVNLLSNAVKFTEEGDVSVLVCPGDTVGEIHFAVRDTGIGISEEGMSKLFQSFSQVDTSTSRKYGGTGLGLAISRRLVELMGGKIWVRSEVGKGSTFHFTILAPAAAGLVLAEKSPKKAKDSPSSPSRDLSILLAEDNPVNQKVALLMLKHLGYSADVAASGIEVLDALERQHYDVILMDVQMPEMDGLETARRIRETRLKSPPKILAMTAYALEGDRKKCLDAGMDGYISKPVKIEELQSALESLSGAQGISEL